MTFMEVFQLLQDSTDQSTCEDYYYSYYILEGILSLEAS